MNNLHYFLIALTLGCVGCHSSRVMQIRDTPPDIIEFDVQCPEKLSNSFIIFKNGTILNVDSLVIDRGSVIWIESGMVRNASVDSMDRITWSDHLKGGLDGLGWGLALGSTGGLLVGKLVDDNDADDVLPGFLVGAILGGGSGLLVGFVAGVISGHPYTLSFERAQ